MKSRIATFRVGVTAAFICFVSFGCNAFTSAKEKGPNNENSTTVNNTSVTSPNIEPNVDPNVGTNIDPNGEPNVEPNIGPNVGPGVAQLDLLYISDNSGSMCQEQKELRDNFGAFIDVLIDSGVDFHIGITTTHMNADYPLEPVAVPGHLQSTPQPVPGFNRGCQQAIDSNGDPIPGDYSPVREIAQFAAECAGLDPSNYNWSDDDIACVALQRPEECSLCPGESCTLDDIMPQNFPDFPTVFRADDYRNNDGSFDRDALLFDFGCASLVGTRGYGVEKGLEAAVLATSRELTGGAVGSVDAEPTAPNHGLFRQNSRIGLLFLSDENDCSHDGSLSENSACGDDVCEFANAESVNPSDSPLFPVNELAEELLTNLSDTTGRVVTFQDVAIASLHGPSVRLTDPTDPESCQETGYTGVDLGCTNATLGKIASGDRYARFAAEFPNTYPAGNGTIVPESLCSGSFSTIMEGSAEALIR